MSAINSSFPPRYTVGQKVELNDGRLGTIRFEGSTLFSDGHWIGVELNEPTGKNDGSVQAKRYFQCKYLYGIFCRPTGISAVIEDPKPARRSEAKQAGKQVGAGPASRARPSSIQTTVAGTRRPTLAQENAAKRSSTIQGSPTPAPRAAAGLKSPMKSPTKQLGTSPLPRNTAVPASGTAKQRTSLAAAVNAPSRRTSTVPTVPGSRASKPPVSGTINNRPGALRSAPGRAGASRPSISTRGINRERLRSTNEESANEDASEDASARDSVDSPTTASQQGATESDAGNGEASEDDFSEHEDAIARPNFAPPTIPSAAATERSMGGRRPSSPTAASIHSQRTIRSSAQTNRYVEELEAKVRLLERKRVEDRELRREIEQTQGDRDKAHGIIERLNNKVRPQQQEIEQLKKMLADYESRFQSVEDLKASHEIELENALLDREMAEETAETLKADLEQVRLRNEELEMELEIMKEENSELSKDMSPEDRSNAGWLQLQKTNERLKEALLNLRDMTQDREAELKERIAAMEEQVKDNDNVKLRLGEIQEKLLRSEADADDLRQQLEVALNAEDMIEKLSEENMALKDRIGELDGIIEDLEDLREVNDELEINHIETEKQLQEEIDFKDSLLVDRERTAREQQAALDEADYNINRFRALVTQMQSDLQDLQASKQISETEAAELSSKSRAMLDLNQKLQSSAAKTQVKTIDLELRKLDAEQAAQHLSIVQLFLPETYQTERDSVLALLRFRRISFKSNLIQTFIKERIASFGTRGQDEDVFAACDALDKLTWIAGIAERLTASISSCSAQAFAEYGGALYELEVVERMLDSYIDSLRRDELREADMAIRLGRSIEVMTHLASLHLHNGLADHADDLTTRTALLQSHLDSSISALTVTRNMVERNLPSSSDDMEYEDESVTDAALILNKLKTVIEYVRSAKVISGKTLRSLTELQSRALTLEESHTQRFETAEQLASAITTYCCQSGAALQQLFGEEGRNDRASPSEVSATLARTASSIFALPSTEAGPLATLNNRLRDLTTVLSDLSNLPTDLDNTVEFERAPAPWLARAEEIKHAKEANVDLEAELARAQEHVRERDGLVRRKEMELNEQTIRIEMLEARLKDASKRSAKLGELERDLRDARNAEAKAKAELARAQQDAQADMNRAREEMARLSEQGASGGKLGGAGNKHVDGDTVGFNARISMERQEYRVAGLQGAVRHLKDENQRLRMPAYGLGLDWIEELPLKKSRRTRAMEAEKTVEYLMKLCAQSPSIDLSKATENKLAWRPAKQTPRWQIEGKKGQWAEYHDRLDDVVSRAEASVRRVRKTESAV